MKKFLFLLTILLLGFTTCGCASQNKIPPTLTVKTEKNSPEQKKLSETAFARIKISIDKQEVIIRLYDNPASQDLLNLLPLTLTFKDYVQKEKISYLPKALSTQNVTPNDNQTGDFAYFAPWGNLACFYKDIPKAGGGLVILGTIESGKNVFSNLNNDFTAVIEKIN